LNALFTNHGSAIFLGTLLCIVLVGVISRRQKPREERPDPPEIFAPIRGMYVCYECDTVFNTIRCPKCNEDAVIPLVHLTGSIEEDKRIASVVAKLQEHSTWNLPVFQDKQVVALAPPCRPEPSNGVPKVSATLF